MGIAERAKVMEQVFSGSTALAGLILVFLGSIYASYEKYATPDRKHVRGKFVRRCWATFFGFFFSLVSAFLAILFSWQPEGWVFWGSLTALAASSIILLCIGIRLNLDIG